MLAMPWRLTMAREVLAREVILLTLWPTSARPPWGVIISVLDCSSLKVRIVRYHCLGESRMASILPPQAAWLQVCGDAKLSFKSRNQVTASMLPCNLIQITHGKGGQYKGNVNQQIPLNLV